jgi:histidyl-tRNA synthetase
MAEKTTPRLPAGMRDILPAQMIKRQYVLDIVREVFEKFGFEPLQTSAIELSETLMGKYGEDAERLIFKTWYGESPNAELSLRYDLSVPLCRVVGMYADLPRPFKRYQIAPVYRADRPQKGRYREFYQCDVDIVGSDSMLADAEIIAVIYEILRRLGFEDLTISINNRKVLNGIGTFAGVPNSLLPGLYRSIDKLDKIGLDGVRRELMMVGVPSEPLQPIQRGARLVLQGKISPADLQSELIASKDGQPSLPEDLAAMVAGPLQELISDAATRNVASGELQAITLQLAGDLAPYLRDYYSQQVEIISEDVVNNLLALLQITGPAQEVLNQLEERLRGIEQASTGIQELRDLFAYLDAMGVPESAYQLNFAMVRGLEYYTGPIFETTIRKPKTMPSITGGGRYDDLIGLFSPVSYPATGTSLGLERIIDAMDELGMFPPDLGTTTAQVLVSCFDAATASQAIAILTSLRENGVNAMMYFDISTRLGEQVGYASVKGIPFVVIPGPDELAAGNVVIRRLGKTTAESEQRTVAVNAITEAIQSW